MRMFNIRLIAATKVPKYVPNINADNRTSMISGFPPELINLSFAFQEWALRAYLAIRDIADYLQSSKLLANFSCECCNLTLARLLSTTACLFRIYSLNKT